MRWQEKESADLLKGQPNSDWQIYKATILYSSNEPLKIRQKMKIMSGESEFQIAPEKKKKISSGESSGEEVEMDSRSMHFSSGAKKARMADSQAQGSTSSSQDTPLVWNSLPLSLRHVETVAAFKRALKTFLFRKYFQDMKFLTSSLDYL